MKLGKNIILVLILSLVVPLPFGFASVASSVEHSGPIPAAATRAAPPAIRILSPQPIQSGIIVVAAGFTAGAGCGYGLSNNLLQGSSGFNFFSAAANCLPLKVADGQKLNPVITIFDKPAFVPRVAIAALKAIISNQLAMPLQPLAGPIALLPIVIVFPGLVLRESMEYLLGILGAPGGVKVFSAISLEQLRVYRC